MLKEKHGHLEVSDGKLFMIDYTMIESFIAETSRVAFYQHKEGTSSSYYRIGGFDFLPKRLSISKDKKMTAVSKKGRNSSNNVVGQLLGKFTKAEQSPLKKYPPFSVRTQIWQCPLRPRYIGYGTIGITGKSGKVEGDTGDLIVLCQHDNWEKITIFYFAGMGNIQDLEQAMKYLDKYFPEGIGLKKE